MHTRDVLTDAELTGPYVAKTIRRAVSLLDVSSTRTPRGQGESEPEAKSFRSARHKIPTAIYFGPEKVNGL